MRSGLIASALAAAVLLWPVAVPSQSAGPFPNPRLRVDLAASGPKRLVLRDRLCRGTLDDVTSDPALRRRIVAIAAREWEAFRFQTLDIASAGLPAVPTLDTAGSRGRPRTIVPPALNPPRAAAYARRLLRAGLSEDAREVTLRIGGYWATVPDQSAVEIQNALWRIWADTGWAQPWSAAFVSWVMCEAGLTEAAFERHAQHAGYMNHLYANPATSAYEPRGLDHRPEPGDLLCAGRAATRDIAGHDEARTLALRGASMHCDIVVGGAPDRLFVIGGNVEDAVSLTVVPVKQGRVQPNEARRWFGIFRLRASPDPKAGIADAPFACLGRPDVEACLADL